MGIFPVVTMVWVVSRFRLKAPPGISSSCISPLTSSGQRSRASWASQPQKSPTLSPQPGEKPRKFIRTSRGIGGGGKHKITVLISTVQLHLSGLIGTASHPDMQNIRIIGFFFENRLHLWLEMGKKSLQTAVLGSVFIYL